mgnify:CR=1 FL=1
MSEYDYFFEGVTESRRYSCPACSKDRKKQHLKTLSVTLSGDYVLYNCWHCNLAGKYKRPVLHVGLGASSNVRAISIPKESDQSLIDKYLLKRGIDPASVLDYNLVSGEKYFASEGNLDAIGFVYGDNEAIKWRSCQGKNFTADGAPRCFWGIENIEKNAKQLVIFEGEVDVLSAAAASISNCISVPNGAPQKVSSRKVDPERDKKYSYVWSAKDKIEKADKIVIAVDYDEAGEALAEELIRRIGRAKCARVKFPDGCTDANDVLVSFGPEKLVEIIDEAEPVPLQGIYSALSYKDEVAKLYSDGMLQGASTGIASLDKLMTIVPGQLSVVTGLPGSGKSGFLDHLAIGLAAREGWKFAVASFENNPAIHIAKLSELYMSKKFFNTGDEVGVAPRMSESESQEALEFVDQHFVFLENRDGETSSIDSILDRTKSAIMRLGDGHSDSGGLRGLIIDPYNYISMGSLDSNEHTAITNLLTKLVSTARSHNLHIWLVAHPAKMPTIGPEGETAVPKGMNISGSASFFAKTDLGWTLHRRDEAVELHVWKCRFKFVGSVGMVPLEYDLATGRYSEKTYNLDF